MAGPQAALSAASAGRVLLREISAVSDIPGFRGLGFRGLGFKGLGV